MKKIIYVADDEQNIRELLKAFLGNDYTVEVFETGDALTKRFDEVPADLVILDVMMPGTDGFSACARLRAISDIPIILLTAKDMDADYITGFTMGCDDYFTKPFSPIKLVMRVKSIFHRADSQGQKSSPEELTFGDITIDSGKKTVFCRGGEMRLTNMEFALLSMLFENSDRAVSREELLNSVWGYDDSVETRATDDTVKRLRRKLAECHSNVFIQTVWGYGFRLAKGEPL